MERGSVVSLMLISDHTAGGLRRKKKVHKCSAVYHGTTLARRKYEKRLVISVKTKMVLIFSYRAVKKKKHTPAASSVISSKPIFASCVSYFDRAYVPTVFYRASLQQITDGIV